MEVTFNQQTVTISTSASEVAVGFENPVARELVDRDPYEGSYTITPTREAQVLPVTNLYMTGDLTVNPIPQNYRLITWDGSVLTVSLGEKHGEECNYQWRNLQRCS